VQRAEAQLVAQLLTFILSRENDAWQLVEMRSSP